MTPERPRARHEVPERREQATAPPREAEPQPVDTLLALQRSAGNRAVSAMLARQPAPADSEAKPKQARAATSTLGLGEELGVIPLDTATWGQADEKGRLHELHVSFVHNPAVPALAEAMMKGKSIPEGFYSSRGGKITLSSIVITSLTYSQDLESGELMVSMSVNFTAAQAEPVR